MRKNRFFDKQMSKKQTKLEMTHVSAKQFKAFSLKPLTVSLHVCIVTVYYLVFMRYVIRLVIMAMMTMAMRYVVALSKGMSHWGLA